MRCSIEVQSNIHKRRVLERLEEETGGEEITKEITQEKFPEWKDLTSQIERSHHVPSTNDEKRPKSKYIIMKFQNTWNKETLKAFRNKNRHIQRVRDKKGLRLLNKTQETRWQWSRIFKLLKVNDFWPRILHLAKLANKCEGEIKTFLDMATFQKIVFYTHLLRKQLEKILY